LTELLGGSITRFFGIARGNPSRAKAPFGRAWATSCSREPATT